MLCAAELMHACPSLLQPLIRHSLYTFSLRSSIHHKTPVAAGHHGTMQGGSDQGGHFHRRPSEEQDSLELGHLLRAGCLACSRFTNVRQQTESLSVILEATTNLIIDATADLLGGDNAMANGESCILPGGTISERRAAALVCTALAQLLATCTPIRSVSAEDPHITSCDEAYQTELMCQLHSISKIVSPLTQTSLSLVLQRVQQQGSSGAASVAEDQTVKQLFLSVCDVQTELARWEMPQDTKSTQKSPQKTVSFRQANARSCPPPSTNSETHWWRLNWRRALHVDMPFESPALRCRHFGDKPSGSHSTISGDQQGSALAKSTMEEHVLAEALVRAMPGRTLSCNASKVRLVTYSHLSKRAWCTVCGGT
jgi:hypothetical protein